MTLLLHNAHVIAGNSTLQPGWILINGQRIEEIGEGLPPTTGDAERIDCGGNTALPGFIDLHVHGAVGFDTMDATPEALYAMAHFYAAHGVTGFLATTMTADDPSTYRALENAATCAGSIADGATLLGVHLEGPYLNLAMKGAQNGTYIRRASPAEYNRWLDLGVIQQVTVAPEFPENQQFIRDCVGRGVNVSIGHTQATYEDFEHAVALGARQATHTFNAMIGLHHRQPGTVGAALSLDQVSCEFIADNLHVHPAVLKVGISAKGVEGSILITDSIMGAGMPDGEYALGGQAVTVAKGKATLVDGTLAGSVLTMDVALRNILAALNIPLVEAWPMTSANAARQIGYDDRKGTLAAGYDADVVLLDAQNHVALTIAEGRVVFRR